MPIVLHTQRPSFEPCLYASVVARTARGPTASKPAQQPIHGESRTLPLGSAKVTNDGARDHSMDHGWYSSCQRVGAAATRRHPLASFLSCPRRPKRAPYSATRTPGLSIRYHRPERTIAVWVASRHWYTQGDVWLTRKGAMGTEIPSVGRPGASRGQRKSVHRVDDAVNL